MKRSLSVLMMSAGLLLMSTPALASKAAKAVSQCRDAVTAEQGDAAVAKLKKVQSRGGGFDVWMNIKAASEELRSFCFLKRREVQQFVIEQGRWKSRNPSRPEASTPSTRTAMATPDK